MRLSLIQYQHRSLYHIHSGLVAIGFGTLTVLGLMQWLISLYMQALYDR